MSSSTMLPTRMPLTASYHFLRLRCDEVHKGLVSGRGQKTSPASLRLSISPGCGHKDELSQKFHNRIF